MSPKISVISPIYNAAPFLDRFFETILGQTFPDFELICVDDGSTDESVCVIEHYRRRDERDSVNSQETTGAGAARNAGLDAATGDYLSFLDCDDFFESDMLASMLDAAIDADADICVCRSDAYITDEDEYRAHTRSFVKEYMPDKKAFSHMDAPDYIFNMFRGWAWDKLYRADFIRRSGLRFQEVQNLNDVFFVYASLMRAERITTLDRVLVHKSEHLYESVSASPTKKWDDPFLAYGRLKDWLIAEDAFDRVARSFANRVLRNAIWNLGILSGEKVEKFYAALQSGRLSELGVTADKGADYWHDPADHEELTRILNDRLSDYFIFKLKRQEARYRKRVAELNDRWRRRMKKRMNERQNELKASPTFRAGRILTAGPGLIKRMLRRPPRNPSSGD
jgi:hypothetical protein